MKNLGWIGTIVFVLLISTSSVVFASDTKSFPGSNCRPINGTYPHMLNGWGYLTSLDKAGPRTYRCPIVRDNMAGGGSAVQNAWVRVNDTSTSAVVSCTFVSVRENGSFQRSRTKSTSTSGKGIQTLTFGQIDGASNGVYYINCTLPYGSAVYSYRVKEQ